MRAMPQETLHICPTCIFHLLFLGKVLGVQCGVLHPLNLWIIYIYIYVYQFTGVNVKGSNLLL